MMQSQNCRCGHHILVKIVVVLAWVSGVLFFWTSWSSHPVVWGFNSAYWAWTVVILVLLAKSVKCRCCCGDKHCQTCPAK
jgi:hypothetical protein